MTERESLVAAIATRPGDDDSRRVFADWLDDHGEHARADFVRASVEAAHTRPGTPRRADLLDRAADLLAAHEAAWLGPWRERLVDWDFRRGLLHRVRLTVNAFLRHGEELFRAEPVGRVEVVDDQGKPLGEDAVRAVVKHPAFASVRHCAVVPGYFSGASIGVWLRALAESPHVTGLRRLDAGRPRISTGDIDLSSLRAFCQARHLAGLRALDLDLGYLARTRTAALDPLAEACFAGNLRSLSMALTAPEMRRMAASAVFARLRRLRLSGRNTADAWASLFASPSLTAVESITIPGDFLPAYTDSPMALRVRHLNVWGGGSREEVRRAWHDLIGRAPPPRSLTLDNHNPGREVFTALRRSRWLRCVRTLAIRGDSQGGAYPGSGGIRRLFGPKSMPRLASLDLHEACDRHLLAAMADWPGLARLETLITTDDYHGRLIPSNMDGEHDPQGLRELAGVVLITQRDVELFLAHYPLGRLQRLHLIFAYFRSHTPRRITPANAERVIRDERLGRLTDLTLSFHDMRQTRARLVKVLAEPGVMPRLRRLRVYDTDAGPGDRTEQNAGLRARFGLRFND
jgi:uncharacterized protein (TIGR02996 family)